MSAGNDAQGSGRALASDRRAAYVKRMAPVTSLVDEARIAARSLVDFAFGSLNPTLRLGVTGLSRAGKTVFITALVDSLAKGGRLPVFRAEAERRIASARLAPQPDDTVARFAYESHLDDLVQHRRWPDSTREISELRPVITFQSERRFARANRSLTLDIVDYPGEWLLDLPLLGMSYAEWSADTLRASRGRSRQAIAADFHAFLATLTPSAAENEPAAREAARLFTLYLKAGRDDRFALSTLPPGRFLLPGGLEDTPALTFAPLDLSPGETAAPGTLHAMMERRFEAYKAKVVRPFFLDHFARLDRQIVLVDALAAINAGPAAVADLETALTGVLSAFRVGANSLLSSLFRPRIDRVLFAATKADHLHHANHDRLEAILRRLAERAIARAEYSGAAIDVVALAAVRATREAKVRQGRRTLDAIVGTPVAGETLGGETFDGDSEAAVFPGDLPDDPSRLFGPDADFAGLENTAGDRADYRFLRFRPPVVTAEGALPHIRLDRALEFLIGDVLS